MEECGTCIACGSPPLPFGEDGLFGTKVGNLSILAINRLCSKNDSMLATCDNPRFCPKYDEKEASHMLHKSHHRWAVEFMTLHRKDENMIHDPFVGITGGFPYELNPTTKNKASLIAVWDKPSRAQRVLHTKLYEFISGVDERPFPLDYNLTLPCCKTCNDTMTQRFYFKFHLYDGQEAAKSNPFRLLDNEVIHVFDADTRDHPELQDWTHWVRKFPRKYKQPVDRYQRQKDIMAPAVAYYLHCCLPVDLGANPDFLDHRGQKGLYLYLCWYVLEIVCLMSEYDRGSGNESKKKFNQSPKFYLGPLELYLSHLYWLLVNWKHPDVAAKYDFETWHRYYFSDAINCAGIFSDQAEGQLMAVRVTPGGLRNLSSRQLIQDVSEKIMDLFNEKIVKLVDVMLEKRTSIRVQLYVPSVHHLKELREIASRGSARDFDSHLEHLGVDCMLRRTMGLGKDMDDAVKEKVEDFRRTWTGFEIDNVAVNNGYDKRQATIYYHLCKLLRPPVRPPDTWEGYLRLMEGERCSPWACAVALSRLGAFRAREKS